MVNFRMNYAFNIILISAISFVQPDAQFKTTRRQKKMTNTYK